MVALPPAIVSPEIVAVTPESTWNTPLAPLAVTVRSPAPGPTIVTAIPLLSVSSPWLNAIVRGVLKTVGLKSMITLSADWSACWTAHPRVPTDASPAVLLTTKVEGSRRSSSSSRPGLNRPRTRTDLAVPPRPNFPFHQLFPDSLILQLIASLTGWRPHGRPLIVFPAGAGASRPWLLPNGRRPGLLWKLRTRTARISIATAANRSSSQPEAARRATPDEMRRSGRSDVAGYQHRDAAGACRRPDDDSFGPDRPRGV